MRLGHFDEIGRIEKASDLQHVLHCPAPRFAELAVQHCLFFLIQLHGFDILAWAG